MFFHLLNLARKSLWNRRLTSFLTVLSISVSVCLLLGVEKIRMGARDSFANSVSQTSLIVGARTGQVQLLLYTIFHLGDATNNISWKSYQDLKKDERVEWTIPISLGDSHRGYRVVATDGNFIEHFRYGGDRSLQMSEGIAPKHWNEVILGAEVAKALQYKLEQKIIISHGVSSTGALEHEDRPFFIKGILQPTGTPIDRSVYITLEGMEALHVDWTSGAPPLPGMGTPAETLTSEKLKPKVITAFFLRTKSPIASLFLQRDINEFKEEPLLAVMPGVALTQFWQGIAYVEQALTVVIVFVVIGGLIGMLIALYTSIQERRREMAILRAIGIGPRSVLFLLLSEGSVLTLTGVVVGVLLLYLALFLARPILANYYGLFLPYSLPTESELVMCLGVWIAGTFVGIIPAVQAYRNALADGLTIRV